MNLNLSRRNQSIIAVVLVVLALIGLASWYILRPRASAPSPTASSTPTTTSGTAPAQGAAGGTAASAKPAPKNGSGYSILTNGKQETITSALAGASVTAPINSDVSVENGALMVRPADSAKNELVSIQKTTGAFSDDLAFIRTALNGTQTGFDAVYNSGNSAEYNPGNNLNPGHIYKIGNRLVDDVPAVYLRITANAEDTAPAQDFYLLWVHTGITNWYVVRTAQGLTPQSQAELDGVIGSLSLIR